MLPSCSRRCLWRSKCFDIYDKENIWRTKNLPNKTLRMSGCKSKKNSLCQKCDLTIVFSVVKNTLKKINWISKQLSTQTSKMYLCDKNKMFFNEQSLKWVALKGSRTACIKNVDVTIVLTVKKYSKKVYLNLQKNYLETSKCIWPK